MHDRAGQGMLQIRQKKSGDTDWRRSGGEVVGSCRVRVGRRQWWNGHEGLVVWLPTSELVLRRKVHGGL